MIVLDCSVLLKCFLPEETHAENAFRYLELHQEGRQPIKAPTLLLYEASNVIFRIHQLSKQQARTIIQKILQLGIEFYTWGEDELDRLIDLTRNYRLTAYDASYVLLAEKFQCRLVTADKKLFQSVRELGCVDLLGSL